MFLPFIRIANKHIICNSIKDLFFEKGYLFIVSLRVRHRVGDIHRSDAVREFFKIKIGLPVRAVKDENMETSFSTSKKRLEKKFTSSYPCSRRTWIHRLG